MSAALELACPRDKAPVAPDAAGEVYRCASCGTSYPVEKGVVRFLEERDAFYEGHYADWQPTRFVPRSERIWHAWPLWLIKSGYLWAVRKHVDPGALVAEVGCGSGVVYFGRRYRMIGLDLAHSSLVKVLPLYGTCLQADLVRGLPLPDASVDAVINSFLWEHLTPDTKPHVLADCARALRPGGKLVLLYDVETDNPLFRHLQRRDAALYHQLFIENEHHWGYQSLEENLALFEDAGFRVVENRGLEKTWVQSPWVYDKIRRFGGWPALLSRLGLAFTRPPALYGYTALVRALDAALDGVLPDRWARKVLTVCERR